MGYKSSVDDLVDGIDAVGTLLNNNLPVLKSYFEKLTEYYATLNRDISRIDRKIQAFDETRLASRMDEIESTLEAMTRRMDQLQKSILELLLHVEKVQSAPVADELVDTVKALEDELRKLKSQKSVGSGSGMQTMENLLARKMEEMETSIDKFLAMRMRQFSESIDGIKSRPQSESDDFSEEDNDAKKLAIKRPFGENQ